MSVVWIVDERYEDVAHVVHVTVKRRVRRQIGRLDHVTEGVDASELGQLDVLIIFLGVKSTSYKFMNVFVETF